jgi:SAM-dependent methyltransferase
MLHNLLSPKIDHSLRHYQQHPTMEVAQTYNTIAQDFSKTRYSVWGGVRTFLDSLPPQSLVGDIGCGNGKNMLYKQERLKYEGVDISSEFVEICRSRGLNVKEGSITQIPTSDAIYDHTISIAVIHHLRTREERIKAIRELVRVTKPEGTVLIYVWAAEQPADSRRKFAGGDTIVPFHKKDGSVHGRFYHIYVEGELEAEIRDAIGDTEMQSTYDTGNWCVVL